MSVCVKPQKLCCRQTPKKTTIIRHLMISTVFLFCECVHDDLLHWIYTDVKSAFKTHPDCKHSCAVCVCEPLLLSAGRHLHYTSCGQYTSLLNIWDGLVFVSSIKSCDCTHIKLTWDLSHRCVDISHIEVLYAGLFMCVYQMCLL